MKKLAVYLCAAALLAPALVMSATTVEARETDISVIERQITEVDATENRAAEAQPTEVDATESRTAEETVHYSLVRVYLDSKNDNRLLADMGVLDICGYSVKDGYTELVVNSFGLEQLKNTNFRIEIIEDGLDARLEKYRLSGDLGAYHSVAESNQAIQRMHEDHPGITALEVIGFSWEERPIWAIKISDNPQLDEDEPSVFFNGAHHAREWISYEVPLALAKHLLENYDSDETITELVNEREIWIVPIVNPDGVRHAQTTFTLWRKNRREAPPEGYENGVLDPRTVGVDPNRNYGYMWGDTSDNVRIESETYHGPGPFSEPEVIAVRDLVLRERFDTAIAFHSYSELILYPFGFSKEVHAPDEPAMHEIAEEMARFNGYTPMTIAELYPCRGTADDWFYGEAGIFHFTMELGRDFIPADEDVAPICESNIKAALYLLGRAGNLVDERVETIVQVQDYVEALLKEAAADGRGMSDGEKIDYVRMLRLKKVIAEQLAKEVAAGCPDKAAQLTAKLGAMPPGMKNVFRPVVNHILAAVKNRMTQCSPQLRSLFKEF